MIGSPGTSFPHDLSRQLTGWLAQASRLAEHLRRILLDDIQSIGERLEQPGFRLVVTGDTGRGKRAFLNLLLGSSCQLPTGATPTTATVTTLRAGTPNRCASLFQAGEKKSAP